MTVFRINTTVKNRVVSSAGLVQSKSCSLSKFDKKKKTFSESREEFELYVQVHTCSDSRVRAVHTGYHLFGLYSVKLVILL